MASAAVRAASRDGSRLLVRREGRSVVEVGTPVARRPPHRSRRAVFPHRALHTNSHEHTRLGSRYGHRPGE